MSLAARCRDDPAVARQRTDDDRAVAVFGVITLLAARVERIEIDMRDQDNYEVCPPRTKDRFVSS